MTSTFFGPVTSRQPLSFLDRSWTNRVCSTLSRAIARADCCASDGAIPHSGLQANLPADSQNLVKLIEHELLISIDDVPPAIRTAAAVVVAGLESPGSRNVRLANPHYRQQAGVSKLPPNIII